MKKLILIFLVAAEFMACSPSLSPDASWVNRRWVLTEMRGVPVQLSGTNRDAYISFFPEEKRISGNGGCNRVTGNYTLDKKSEIRFTEVASTKMSCPDINFENAFLSTLDKVDRYEVNGNVMLLKDGNEVLLIFEGK